MLCHLSSASVYAISHAVPRLALSFAFYIMRRLYTLLAGKPLHFFLSPNLSNIRPTTSLEPHMTGYLFVQGTSVPFAFAFGSTSVPT